MDFTPRRTNSEQPVWNPTEPPRHRLIKKQPTRARRRGLFAPVRTIYTWATRHKRIVASIVIVAVAWIIMQQYSRPISKPAPSTSSGKTTTPASTALEKGTPSYPTYLPNGKTIAQLGGWTRVSPPSSNPVYAYTDAIGAIQIIVSQQALPDAFEDDPDAQLKELAQSYGANEHISVKNHTVYIGTSSKGPQSVIFFIDKTLVLIKSSTKLSNDQWVAYIAALQ